MTERGRILVVDDEPSARSALQQLLTLEGYDVEMVTINGTTANNADDQQELIDRCSFPIFQDLDEVGAWDLHGGGKDDRHGGDPSRLVLLSQCLRPARPAPMAPIVTRRAGIHAGELGWAAVRQRRRAP